MTLLTRNTTPVTFSVLASASQGVCTFNDDIQSTAAAVVGAVYGALRLAGVPPLKQQVFLFFGAGQANIGTARLLVSALADEGLTETQAKQQIWLYDSKASLLAPDFSLGCSGTTSLCFESLKLDFCLTPERSGLSFLMVCGVASLNPKP